jgi:3-methyl-2-oxobutanoate hydroxymethyltransferase
MERKPITTSTIRQMKEEGTPISMITAYDYAMARNVDEAGIDMILVGDSLGNVMLGYSSTLPVTMDAMVHHTQAVVRGTKTALVVADMPFMSYQASEEEGLRNAGRLMKEGGSAAVKIEGGAEVCQLVKKMVTAGIPVVGHIGLTPQSVNQFGGFKVQGKDFAAAQKLLDDAKALEAAGAFAVVLECVPAALAKKVTEQLTILPSA